VLPPVFVIVSGSGLLVEFTPCEPNDKLVADNDATGAAGAVPLPASVTWCGLPLALSLMLSVADLEPVKAGVNFTLMVAVPPLAATLNGVGVVVEKSPGFAPVKTRLLTVSVAVPMFVTVISCAALATPCVWLPKFTAVGLRLIPGVLFTEAPVPDSATVCGLPVALSAMLSVADRLPPPAGVNVILTVAEAPAPTLIGVAVVTAKSPAFAPLTVRLEICSVAVPGFETVMVEGRLVVPTFWDAKVSDGGFRLIDGEFGCAPVPLSEML